MITSDLSYPYVWDSFIIVVISSAAPFSTGCGWRSNCISYLIYNVSFLFFSFKCSITEFWLINWLILCWRIRFLGFRKHSSSSHSLCFVIIILEAFFSNTKLASFSDISNVNSEVDSAERKDSQIETVAASERDYRLRGGSMNEQSSSATPGSQTSTTSSDSGWFCCLSTFSATDLIYSWSDLCRMQK